MVRQEDFFTIVSPNGDETRLNFAYDDVGGHEGVSATNVMIQLGDGKPVEIEPQQLTELAALFLALAGNQNDYQSADVLLEGFSLKGKEAAKKLYKALEE